MPIRLFFPIKPTSSSFAERLAVMIDDDLDDHEVSFTCCGCSANRRCSGSGCATCSARRTSRRPWRNCRTLPRSVCRRPMNGPMPGLQETIRQADRRKRRRNNDARRVRGHRHGQTRRPGTELQLRCRPHVRLYRGRRDRGDPLRRRSQNEPDHEPPVFHQARGETERGHRREDRGRVRVPRGPASPARGAARSRWPRAWAGTRSITSPGARPGSGRR